MDGAVKDRGQSSMLVLALDSSTRTGSIALARDGVLVDVCEGDAGRRHAERLPGDLVTLLAAHGCDLRDVTLLAVTAGPGGFTGLRVGLATIQGLALALDRRVFVASTLDLLARAGAEAAADARWVGAWMQGMRGEVFTELHERLSDGRMRRALDAAVGTPDSAATAWADVAADGTLAVIGDGWPTHGDALRARFGERLHVCETPRLAGVLALEASRRAGEAVTPAAVRPAYVRRPDCVVTREQAGLPVAGDR